MLARLIYQHILFKVPYPMPDRLNQIYTRSGDTGTTALANGTRISKTAQRIEVLGTIDELNSCIGLVVASLECTQALTPLFTTIQHQLFDLGGEISIADKSYTVIEQSEIEYLESNIDRLNQQLPPLKEFILPGGPVAACHTHLARSICRRAERHITTLLLDENEFVNPYSAAYLNRLSDLLFVASRIIVLRQGGKEVLWQPREHR